MGFKILMLADFKKNSANTIIDHVTSFRRYSRNNFFFIDPMDHSKPVWLDMNKFDIILLHYSIYILGDRYINETWRDAISSTKAVKIQFLQDEYRNINEFHQRMTELGIEVLFTCVPAEEIEKVYPSEKLKGLAKFNNLTGYVPEYFERKRPDFSMKNRRIDVGYRGRGYGGLFWLGELFQEKVWIGEYFLQHIKDHNIRCDISSREKDRIYGREWLRFMKSCKCMLGTESGASVFDFTGQIEKNVLEHCDKNPDATFSEVKKLFFDDVDGLIRLNQISPRAFEAIGCGTCQVLYEGFYSGILEPDVHFIELKKDFSNIEDVVARIRDDNFLSELAERAYKDIIASGRYSYRSFIRFFDNKVDEYMMTYTEKNRADLIKPAQKSSLNYWNRIKGFTGIMASSIISSLIWLCSGLLGKPLKIKDKLRFSHAVMMAIYRSIVVHPFFKKEKMRIISVSIE
jgi:hypothetical protein